jgi:C-terminal processing protease CtpA/Prc
MKHKTSLIAVTFLALTLVNDVDASEPGWFGINYRVVAEGLFTPVIRSATIIGVAPNSPAARSEIRVGDEVLEVQHVVIAGQQKRTLIALAHKSVGETIHLRLKHETGETYVIALTAAARP